MDLTWEEIEQRAKMRLRGYATIKKLLSGKEYDR